ncbi:cellulose binding domain-containing protein [Pseudosporangium ferrugineum]|uniref:Cellulose binding domain-containing protein n=1 Tax=Pseudosporangium ferrugineum TaxID=439699 RepID=A0A2T0RI30_9ACTN|nr:cellulose binding domain-containing protein [Pseudosporangium ferrugineum]PRY20809.1 cellulose binding domain-containing protein [Pseudosporangium ferrugineum]
MSEPPRRERRSPMVVLLDAAMKLAVSAQAGPQPRLEPAGQARRTARTWLVLGALLAIGGTIAVVTVLLQGPDDLSSLPPHTPARTTVAGDTSSSESASALPATSGATGTAPAPGTAPTTAAPGAGPSAPLLPPTSSRPTERATVPSAVALTARYSAANGTGLLGYRAEVAVANPGTAGHDGWELTLTLPRPTLQIAAVSGATARQDGATWTFAPDATTRSVPAGGSVVVSFEVRGATLLDAAPQACQIDGRRCAGVGPTDPPPA